MEVVMSRKLSSKFDDVLNSITKIFLMVATIIAVGVLIVTFININSNTDKFTQDITEVLGTFYASGGVFDTSTNELLTLRMQYLEKISEMHKQASNNDLFVFMYGFISSVLIGICAYMVKKGQDQLETLSKKYKKIDGITDDLLRLNIHENSIHFNIISQVLSEALISILSYNISLGNENLTFFKQSLRGVSDLCKRGDFSKINETAVAAFERTIQTIGGVYASAANKEDSEIDETHKKYIKEELDEIQAMFRERHK
jgi:hypothetical protein